MNLNRQINIRFNDVLNHQVEFDKLNQFVDFLKSEAKFWKTAADRGVPKGSQTSGLVSVSGVFTSILNTISSWENMDDWEDNVLQSQIESHIRNQLSNLQPHNKWLWSGHPFTPKFIDIHATKGSETAQGFLSYISSTSISNIHQKAILDGALLGYEYTHQNSDLVKRSKSERATITRLRDQLLDKNRQTIEQLDHNQTSFDQWFDEAREDTENWLRGFASSAKRRHGAIKTLARRGSDTLQADFEKKMKIWQQRVSELEVTYEEKLRLKKPAQYWQVAAKRYRQQGIFFILLTLTLVISAVLFGLDLFEIWLIGGESLYSVKTVQGAVLFATLAALFGFALRAISRLAFSAFHLMRDAEEREQLTYLYLSLINESAIEKDSRDIVLQALFSRSETGLLAQESGPTMPGLGEALRATIKSK